MSKEIRYIIIFSSIFFLGIYFGILASVKKIAVTKREYVEDFKAANEQMKLISEMLKKIIEDRKDPLREIHQLFDSIIKVESAYNPDVVSHKNAIGLMQIKLPTAREVANNLKLTEEDLKIPEINLIIGIKYFFQLLRKYDGDVYIALEAYNRGMGVISEDFNDDGEINYKYSLKVIDQIQKIDKSK